MVVRCMEIKKMVGRNTSRVDTSALKFQIEKKLGRDKSQKYFNLLSRYFSCKINKSEFNKQCVSLIGRENLRLHNLLIQAVVKNVSIGKIPPPKEREKETKVPNGYPSSFQTHFLVGFPQSLRKKRTQHTRARKFKDHPIPFGPNRETPIVGCEDKGISKPNATPIVVCEDNSISIPNVQEQQIATSLLSLGSKPPREMTSVEDGEEVEQASRSPSIYSRSPIRAPFGISTNCKEPQKVLRNGSPFSSLTGSCLSSGELPNTSSLRCRLEQKLDMEGFKISSDCVNLLNCSLDVYLKRLIKPCVQLASTRAGDKHSTEIQKQVMFGLNGLRPVRHITKPSKPVSASLLDFQIAMELNPSRLGEDWPELLEKVCLQASD